MKPLKLILGLGLLCAMSVQGDVTNHSWSGDFDNNGEIPDANTAGWSDSRPLSGLLPEIENINVQLNISGGFNGDLYGYLALSYEIGPPVGFTVLLNRVGRTSGNLVGYDDSGFNVTFDDAASNGDIHFYQSVLDPGGTPLTGIWQPDGRDVDPLTIAGTPGDARDALLSSFVGSNPNGTWTLFIADLSGGGGLSIVQSWGLEITAVPEPSTWAMGVLGTLALIGWRRRKKA